MRNSAPYTYAKASIRGYRSALIKFGAVDLCPTYDQVRVWAKASPLHEFAQVAEYLLAIGDPLSDEVYNRCHQEVLNLINQ